MMAAGTAAPLVDVRAVRRTSVGLEVADAPDAGPDDFPSPVRRLSAFGS